MLGTDKAYDTKHVAPNVNGPARPLMGARRAIPAMGSALRIRKRIEEAFGWIKIVAGQDKTKFRGRDRVG